MTRIERAKEVFARTLSILQIEEQMYDVDDEYLETWMMEGCPNGSTVTEIMEEKEVFARTLSILQIEEQMYDVDDEYLETWMMEGCPNGSTVTEIMEDVDDDETYHEWLTLGQELLSRREKEEADY